MTDTSQTTLRSELRIARSALKGLRDDLITDAFAFRPLPPRRIDGPVVSRLPDRFRESSRWLPHATLTAFACFLMLAGYEFESERGGSGLAAALLTGIPLVTVLFRPVGGWWLSLAAGFLGGAAGHAFSEWPWTATGFVSHVVVMAVVAGRTRPRVAAEMWLLTTLLGVGFASMDPWQESDGLAMSVVSFLVLLAVVLVRGWRETQQKVVEQVAVTEVERSRRTVLEERTTIARELHDVVAHHMSVIAIQAEAAPYRVDDPPAELTRSFAIIRENAVAALTELRRVLGVVRADNPDAFTDSAPEAPQPTLATLDSLLANVRDTGAVVDKVVTGAVRTLPQGVELSAYRIVQEGLSNALRHAPGADIRVEIGYVLSGLGLRVVNGPATVEIRPSHGAGHGVLGMRERVSMLAGEMTAEPTAEGGYEVTAFIPVAAEPKPEPDAYPDVKPDVKPEVKPGPVSAVEASDTTPGDPV
ncbi:histidine kinase [Streptomyces sp. H10-C2]|uniref:sensor histidine kinase n=1 Tax=unclassified Streptomyces TaxID=2593676 RepID=UPI0024BB0100|nr:MULTISPECIES: histidine kinase [unclassified Streptomyces]MDJ0340398.1 histidine kinase [Streptomyces sp. PH10-H1]MDJ0368154.1 histidine kinase [Streptomyces sp. H10-C2]